MTKTSKSLNNLAYHILNDVRGNRSQDFPDLTIDQIKFALKYYRALFIRRDQQRNFNRYRMFEQDLGLVDVDYFDTAESNTVDSYKEIVRTVDRIPTPIRMKEWEGITHISDVDKTGEPIPVVDAHRGYWNQFSKYTEDNREAYYRNGYIYIRSQENAAIEKLNIRGIFEDPEEVYNYKGVDEEGPFPIPEDMTQRIVQGLLNGELSFAVQTQGSQAPSTNQQSNQ